jgi:DegV family protein with EDD domain
MKKIVVDSGANLLEKSIKNVECVNVPLTLTIENQAWSDDEALNLPAFTAALQQTSQPAASSCPNLAQWLAAYGDADEIYVLTITGKMSGSYNTAQQAAAIYLESHPAAKIQVFDSLSAGPAMHLMAEKLAELINSGLSFDRVVMALNEFMSQVELIFALGSLDNLAANGRISPVLAKVAHLMNLRVIGTADQGSFKMLTKARGPKKCCQAMISQMEQKGYQGGAVRIDHVQNRAAAEQFQQLLLAEYPHANVVIGECRGLCSFYAEQGGLMIGFVKGNEQQ